jgi:starch phosphorylase
MPTAWREHLDELARNLWWSWDGEATALWASIDPFRWETYHHNPLALLADVEPEAWEALERQELPDRVRAVHARFRSELARDTWCAREAPEVHRSTIAYFSMEFGLHESLRLYSGGLGVLAGDHLRSASDLGVPLVAVSLLYGHGYFRQVLAEGRQLAAYPRADWSRLPVRECRDASGEAIEVEVPIADRVVRARLWELAVGRCRLLLLDTDHEGNDGDDRGITRELYGGDEWTRIRQEMVLGLGGVAALRRLALDPAVFHLNEGHCAFVPLGLVAERIASGATFDEAWAAVRARCVFTTHTPVQAGHDRFTAELFEKAFGPWAAALGLDVAALMDLGRVRPGAAEEPHTTTVLALRASGGSNAVSALHGEVTRKMWHALWPDRAEADVPIGHVTNGVHPTFWMPPEARALFDQKCPGWTERVWDESLWSCVDGISDDDLLRLRALLRRKLVDEVAVRGGRRFDPDALTIGFARRFTSYKRGNLLFSDPARLKRLLDAYPIQIVYAGKAHPRDTGGQQIVSEIIRRAEHRDFRHRVVLLQDYDIALGRILTSGADVWLNNPRRPHEASGTSGQKVVLGGGLNLSVLDGWWPEAWDGTNGWSIGDGQVWEDEAAQDAHDADALYRVLEEEVVPEWIDRTDGLPRRWIARIRRSIRTCVPRFTSHRMVRDYTLQLYAPRCR